MCRSLDDGAARVVYGCSAGVPYEWRFRKRIRRPLSSRGRATRFRRCTHGNGTVYKLFVVSRYAFDCPTESRKDSLTSTVQFVVVITNILRRAFVIVHGIRNGRTYLTKIIRCLVQTQLGRTQGVVAA